MSGRGGSSGDLTAPFIFVPTGDPEPTDWMAAHPDWIKIPATLVPRGSASSGSAVPAGIEATAVAGTAAAAAPGIAEGVGAGLIGGVGEVLAAALAPLAALGILLYPSRTASPDWTSCIRAAKASTRIRQRRRFRGWYHPSPATRGREKVVSPRYRPRHRSQASTRRHHRRACCRDGRRRNRGQPSSSRTATTGLLVGQGPIPAGARGRPGGRSGGDAGVAGCRLAGAPSDQRRRAADSSRPHCGGGTGRLAD